MSRRKGKKIIKRFVRLSMQDFYDNSQLVDGVLERVGGQRDTKLSGQLHHLWMQSKSYRQYIEEGE